MTPEHLEAKNQKDICERIEKGFIQTINCDPTYFYSTLEISKKHMYSKNVLLTFCPLRPLLKELKMTKMLHSNNQCGSNLFVFHCGKNSSMVTGFIISSSGSMNSLSVLISSEICNLWHCSMNSYKCEDSASITRSSSI